jgi:putative transcriptional regulator
MKNLSILTAAFLALTLTVAPKLARSQDVGSTTFVVALKPLDNSAWKGTVMVAFPYGGGHVGLIINRPTKTRMGQVFPDFPPALKVEQPIYVGGPMAQRVVLALTRAAADPGGNSLQVLPGVWLLKHTSVIDALMEKDPNALRYFMGYVWWNEGELSAEVSKGMMALAPASAERLFLPDTSGLYNELVPNGRVKPLTTDAGTGDKGARKPKPPRPSPYSAAEGAA